MSKYSEYVHEEIAYIPEDEWPFNKLDMKAGLREANKLAPKGTHWVYNANDQPSFHLLDPMPKHEFEVNEE